VRLALSSQRDRVALIAALLAPLCVSAILVPFRSSFPNTDAALVLVVVIVAVAANGQRLSGLVAAASAAVWFDFFLTRPYEHFSIAHRADIETTLLLLLVGAAVTEIAVRRRRDRAIALTDEAYLAAIGQTADLVAAREPARAVIDQVTVHLLALLDLRGCRFERFSFGGLPRLEADGQLHLEGRVWDVDRDGMPARSIEVLAGNRSGTYGRFVLEPTPGAVVSLAARQVAGILVAQVASALASEARLAS
jgi:uncharacterized protein DUF4118